MVASSKLMLLAKEDYIDGGTSPNLALKELIKSSI